MKNLNKFAVIIILVTVAGLSSCVKNEVSPEVTALRKGQVDLLKAQVAQLNADVQQILANASSTEVDTRYTRMNIYFDSLFNVVDYTSDTANLSYSLKVQDAQLVQALLHIDNEVLMEQKIQQQNELAVAQATATYNMFINQGQFQQNVSDLLGKYNNESNVLQQLYSDRITLNKQIAEDQLLLTTENWDIVKARFEDRIADLNSKLTAQNAALTAYEGVVTDPTSLESAINNLDIEIAGLQDKWDSLETDYELAYNTWQQADALVTHANFVITIMENWDPLYGSGYLNDLDNYNATLVANNATLAAAIAALTPLNNALTLATSTLTAAKSALTSATAAYNAKLALYNTALTNNTNAQNDINTKAYLLQIATDNYNAGAAAVPPLAPAALTALQTLMTNAQTAYNTALAVRDDPTGTAAKLSQAGTDRDAAYSTMSDAQSDVDNAQSDVDGAQSNVDSQNDNIKTATDNVAQTTNDIAIITAKIAEWQTDYDASKANILTLEANSALLSKKHILISIEQNKVSDMMDELGNVKTTLVDHFTGIQGAIIDQKLAIGSTQDDIADLQDQIAHGEINRTFLNGQITNLQALLATTEIKITNSEGIVAVWKKMLDDAIAAQG
jgi:chromosome segregation ATPase